MRLIGIAGKKQSGKNTVANILHGIVLKEQGMISEYTISPDGQLLIKTDEILEWAETDKMPVTLISIVGGGHTFPNPVYSAPRILGATSHEADAAELVWAFFERIVQR